MVEKNPFDLGLVGWRGSASSSFPVDDGAAVIDLDGVGGPAGVVGDREDGAAVEPHLAVGDVVPDAVAHLGAEQGQLGIVAGVEHLQVVVGSGYGEPVELVERATPSGPLDELVGGADPAGRDLLPGVGWGVGSR